MLHIEVGPNIVTVLLAALALIGTVVTAVLAYLNGQQMKKVEENTNGLTQQLVQQAYQQGHAAGMLESNKSNK